MFRVESYKNPTSSAGLSSVYFIFYLYFFLARRSKLRIDTRHAQKEQRDIANKNTRINRSSGNAVSWPAGLVVQSSIPAGGENLLKSKLGYIAHNLHYHPPIAMI